VVFKSAYIAHMHIMKIVMQILDFFELPGLGVIISGTNSDLDSLSNEQIEKYIGNEVLIQKADNSLIEVDGVKVDIGTSLIGRKNIHICLAENIKLSDLERNATVLSK
jgi:hypothetical protein